MQCRSECFCPRSKWWLCDGNCLDYEFRNNTIISLDDPLPDGEGTLADYVPDNAPLIGEVLAEKAKLNQLLERLQELMSEAKRIGALQDFIGSQQFEITEFDESLVRKLIQQITVYDDQFTVEFKSGITIEIEASSYIRRNGP
mgnify:FL=1